MGMSTRGGGTAALPHGVEPVPAREVDLDEGSGSVAAKAGCLYPGRGLSAVPPVAGEGLWSRAQALETEATGGIPKVGDRAGVPRGDLLEWERPAGKLRGRLSGSAGSCRTSILRTDLAAAHEPYLSLIAPSHVAGVPPDGEVADATRRCCCSPDVGYPGCAPRAAAATAVPRQRRGSGSSPRRRSTPSAPWAGGSTSVPAAGASRSKAWPCAATTTRGAFAVDVVKDLAPPDSGTVPYLTLRAFIVGGSNRGSTTSSGERAWGLGCRPRPGARVRDHRVVRRPAVLHRAGSLRRLLPEHPALGGRGVYAVTR